MSEASRNAPGLLRRALDNLKMVWTPRKSSRRTAGTWRTEYLRQTSDAKNSGQARGGESSSIETGCDFGWTSCGGRDVYTVVQYRGCSDMPRRSVLTAGGPKYTLVMLFNQAGIGCEVIDIEMLYCVTVTKSCVPCFLPLPTITLHLHACDRHA